MSRYFAKVTVEFEFDDTEYAIPADLNIRETLMDDVSMAVEENMSVEVEKVTVTAFRKIGD
jgi:hypothetical protein